MPLIAIAAVMITSASRLSIAQRLLDLGKPPEKAVACIERAATARQQVTRCTLRELALPGSSPAIANPAVIVIGPTVSLLPSDG
jgi:siroheme synthase